MKIGDVEVGKEYGARASSTGLCRQVRAEEIVVVQQRQAYTRETRNVRKVKVTFLDPKTDTRWPVGFQAREQGAVAVLEARHLVGTWEAINAEQQARDEARRIREEREDAIREVLATVGIDGGEHGRDLRVSVAHHRGMLIEVTGTEQCELLLAALRIAAAHAPAHEVRTRFVS